MHWGRLSEESIRAVGFKQPPFKEYDGMVHTSSNQVRSLFSYFFGLFVSRTIRMIFLKIKLGNQTVETVAKS
jgi:hypothetical protein